MTGQRRIAVMLCIVLAGAARAASPYDPPKSVVRTPLPRDPDNPSARPKVSCFRYPGFTVSEVDLGEIGAETLAINPGPPAGGRRCGREAAPGERVIPGAAWTGYFAGAKGPYAVFEAEDGWQGGMGFAVFDARSGGKLFDDAYRGGFEALRADRTGLTLTYRRVFAAKCSLKADPGGCWRAIRGETGLAGSAPDCAAAYRRETRRTPKFAAQVRADPSVIEYEAVARLEGGRARISPRGAALACRPSE